MSDTEGNGCVGEVVRTVKKFIHGCEVIVPVEDIQESKKGKRNKGKNKGKKQLKQQQKKQEKEPVQNEEVVQEEVKHEDISEDKSKFLTETEEQKEARQINDIMYKSALDAIKPLSNAEENSELY